VSNIDQTDFAQWHNLYDSPKDAEGPAMVGQLNDRVLLIDDEYLVRKLISRHLVAAGYVVRVAVDGLDALQKLRAGLPDLIISDLNMPRMAGLELLAIVRKRFPQIPVIVISGVAPDELPEGLAADAYYHKNGFGFEPLLETISGLTRKPPLRAAPPCVDNTPVPTRWDGDGHYILGCADCLRRFSIPRAIEIGPDENWTTCVHCGKVVQFLVADGERSGGLAHCQNGSLATNRPDACRARIEESSGQEQH
jgi:CheY-like chemotaxis protein